jgi:pimeloyl-ACP methyl ester carboxylesterase
MIARGYVVYMFDKRNYGYSTREKAMDAPAADNQPVSCSPLVIRDIGAVVDHIRAKHKVARVNLIGWSWGATTAGYYTSLNSEKVKKLVTYAPAEPARAQRRARRQLHAGDRPPRAERVIDLRADARHRR